MTREKVECARVATVTRRWPAEGRAQHRSTSGGSRRARVVGSGLELVVLLVGLVPEGVGEGGGRRGAGPGRRHGPGFARLRRARARGLWAPPNPKIFRRNSCRKFLRAIRPRARATLRALSMALSRARLDGVLLISRRGSAQHETALGRVAAAGLPTPLIIDTFDGHAAAACLRDAHAQDPSVTLFNRTGPVEGCGFAEARQLGVSPPVDPRVAWPGTSWNKAGDLRTTTDGGPAWENAGTWGSFGSTCSHVKAWHAIANRSSTHFSLILEDDVLFAAVPPTTPRTPSTDAPSPPPSLTTSDHRHQPGRRRHTWHAMLRTAILNLLPSDVHFVYLGFCHPRAQPLAPLLYQSNQWCLHAYLITPQGARRLVSALLHDYTLTWAGSSRHLPGRPRWNVSAGARYPTDFVTHQKAVRWLNAYSVNEARAAAMGLVSRDCLTAWPVRSGGLVWQDRVLGNGDRVLGTVFHNRNASAPPIYEPGTETSAGCGVAEAQGRPRQGSTIPAIPRCGCRLICSQPACSITDALASNRTPAL